MTVNHRVVGSNPIIYICYYISLCNIVLLSPERSVYYYAPSTGGLPYYEAEAECVRGGGHVAAPRTAAERDALVDVMLVKFLELFIISLCKNGNRWQCKVTVCKADKK